MKGWIKNNLILIIFYQTRKFCWVKPTEKKKSKKNQTKIGKENL